MPYLKSRGRGHWRCTWSSESEGTLLHTTLTSFLSRNHRTEWLLFPRHLLTAQENQIKWRLIPAIKCNFVKKPEKNSELQRCHVHIKVFFYGEDVTSKQICPLVKCNCLAPNNPYETLIEQKMSNNRTTSHTTRVALTRPISSYSQALLTDNRYFESELTFLISLNWLSLPPRLSWEDSYPSRIFPAYPSENTKQKDAPGLGKFFNYAVTVIKQ